MDSTSVPLAAAHEFTAVSETIPSESAFDASVNLDPTDAAQESSTAPAEEESMSQPTSASAVAAGAASVDTTGGAAALSEAPAEPTDTVAEQAAAPPTEAPASDIVDEPKAAVDNTVLSDPATSGPEATSPDIPGDVFIAPGPSTAGDASADATSNPQPAVSGNEATEAASTTNSALADASASATDESAPTADVNNASQPPASVDQAALVSESEPGSTTIPPAASSSDGVQSIQPAGTSELEQSKAAATVNPSSESPPTTSVVAPETSAATTEPASTTEVTIADPSNTTTVSADAAAAESTQEQPAQVISPAQNTEAADVSSTQAAEDAENLDDVSKPAVSVPDQQQAFAAKADDPPTQLPSSSDIVAAAPAVTAAIDSEAASTLLRATPKKKTSADGASATQPSSSQPSTPVRESRVALILRINKELIRLCVDMHAKELTMDPVYREAAVRLQANLGYLASIADQAGKSVDPSGRAPPKGALPRLEPFPRSEHAPSSLLPALFDKLISLFGAAQQSSSPSAEGKKRSRDSTADLGAEDSKKRAASRGLDRSQDVSAAGTPSSASNQPQASANTPTTAKFTDASTGLPVTSDHGPASTSAASAQQGAPQQPPQSSKGPDLSLVPPVPIAPPAAAQNIPNNPQAQALLQAFGPNALVNLHALQSHLRGQGTHPWVAFMEANVAGFKNMPLQVQLQNMTSLQNAALQRQKAMQGGGGGQGSAVGSPASMQQPQQMMANGGMGGVSSPATTRPGSRHSDSPGQAQASPSASAFGSNVAGRSGTPLGGQTFQKRPGSSGSVGSMTSAGGRNRTGSSNLAFDASQLQSAPSPATMASMAEFAGQQQPNFGFQSPGLQQGSPAAAASPTQQAQQQQQQQQGMAMAGIPNFQNLPPHLQQQIRQQYMAHMQAQAQAQGANPQQQGFAPQQQQFFQSPQ